MTLSLSPIADAYVASAASGSNFGLDPELRSKRSNLESYLKFDISGVGTESITSAKLRLTGGLSDTSATNVVTQVFGVSSTSWTETGVVWSNKPSSSSTALSSVTIVNNLPAPYEWDVSTFFKTQQGSGRTVVSLAVKNPSNSTPYATFQSRESSTGTPELVLTTTPPPTVSITAPASGTTLLAPANITLEAEASDSDGIAKVEFLQGSTVLGSDTTFPYTFAWNNVAVGQYTLVARATDTLGGTALSPPILISVSTTFPPVVSITSPGRSASFLAPATVTITADATDSDGISKVDFFEGNNLIGSATSAPYTIIWSGMPPCGYFIRAKATDALGATAISTPVFVKIIDGTIGESTPPNFKVAFFGDQGLGPLSVATLNLVVNEGAQALVLAGDLDYADNPTAWEDQLNSTVGPNFPVFTLSGNHDEDAWYGPIGYQHFIQDRFNRLGIPWCGSCGVQSALHYKGIFFVFTTPGLNPIVDPGHNDSYIREQLAGDHSIWSVVSWHKNMGLMQAGGKSDETGWEVYEEARAGGAIIVNAHEHSYFRTHLLSSMMNQTVASTANMMTLSKGESFVAVSGLGGQSRRDQEVTGPWIARISAAICLPGDPICEPDAVEGALFGVFNVGGQQNKANFYYKDVNGRVIDSFTVISQVDMPNVANISPGVVSAGADDFTLTVNGSGFIAQSQVVINGTPRDTSFVSSTELTTHVAAADVLPGGPVPVKVLNSVTGGGTSNELSITVLPPPNPVPVIDMLFPSFVTANTGDLTLTITGANFVSNSIIRLDGIDRPTTFLSPTELTTSLNFADTQTPRLIAVTVFNPEPAGGSSNTLDLTVAEAGYEGDVAPRPNGSNNGTVSIADWVQLGRFASGLDILGCDGEFVRADVAPRDSKGNGTLSISDWVQAGRYAAGMDPAVPAGGPSCTLPASNTTFNAAFFRPLSYPQPSFTRSVRIAIARTEVANTREVSVSLDALGDENAVGFTLQFLPTQLTYVSVKKENAASGAILSVNGDHAARGFLGIALALPPGNTLAGGSRRLLSITFKVSGKSKAPLLSFSDKVVKQEVADTDARVLEADFGQRLPSVAGWIPPANRIDDARFFVTENYRAILGRLPDSYGLDYWTNQITSCGIDLVCVANRRIAVSTSFFLEQEFKESGFLIYQLYRASLGRQPHFEEFLADRNRLNAVLDSETREDQFLEQWTQRDMFNGLYPVSLYPEEFVNRLYNMAGIYAPFERTQQIRALRNGEKTRGEVLGDLIRNSEFVAREYNGAFVRMAYFAYLQRDPDPGGELFWLSLLNRKAQPDLEYYRSIICGFVTSAEYQLRFGPVITRQNSSCTP